MNTKRLVAVAIAATLLIGGVAAVGAASPVDSTADDTDEGVGDDGDAEAADDDP